MSPVERVAKVAAPVVAVVVVVVPREARKVDWAAAVARRERRPAGLAVARA
jgi:hypothetical protein